MRSHLILVLALLGQVTVSLSAQQDPGDYPRMVLVDADGLEVPEAAGPFDNSNVFTATAGEIFRVQTSYLAAAQPNQNVPWALLVSAFPTPFPTDLTPPPLLTLPPFELIFPFPFTLDAAGQGELLLAVPSGLFGIEIYLQAIIEDTSNVPFLQLSNGTRMTVDPPDFNVRFSFVRAVPALGAPNLEGVVVRDIDGDTLKTHPPLGTTVPPNTDPVDIGLPAGGFQLVPIVANEGDAPVNPLARPTTTVTQGASGTDNVLFVDDTSFFPSEGFLYVAANGSNLFADKAGSSNAPTVEVIGYGSKTGNSFLQLRRKLIGSTGLDDYPHVAGDLVLGEFTMVTTAGARSRERIGLDATNIDMPHVVLPATTFDSPEGGSVTMELDVYRYQSPADGQEGFMVFDHVAQEWRLIDDTVITSAANNFWDPMVAISPDHRFMIATVRVTGGAIWASDADELWAIRLDGSTWPASGSEAWQIDYDLGADPTMDDNTVRGRRVHMPSVAIIGPDAENYVAFVGLAHKHQKSPMGNNNFPNEGYEGFWVREEVLVRDYIDVPLVAPGSTMPAPPATRTYITGDFPATGTAAPVIRFDPVPLVAPDRRDVYISAGSGELADDMYRVTDVGIDVLGEVFKRIENISGYGAPGGIDPGAKSTRLMHQGGHARGGKAALSPGGTRIAFLREQNANRDFLNVIRTNGADFAQAQNFTLDFTAGTDFGPQHIVAGLNWYDEDKLYFVMGRNPYPDPFVPVTDPDPPGYEVFSYTVSTNTVTQRTVTPIPDPTADPDDVLMGTIQPAAVFTSPSNEYYFVARGGLLPEATASVPAMTPVMNIISVHMASGAVFDVTGDELVGNSLVTNADLPPEEVLTPVETVTTMRFTEGSGANAGLMYFAAHTTQDPTLTDELFGFNMNQPSVAFQATTGSPPGAHITNVAANPYSASVAFARTFVSDPYANAQHPYVIDLDNFLFLRDLTPDVQVGGVPFGRLMDGSFHFVPPTPGVGDALIFAMGSEVEPNSEGIAQRTAAVYYPLTNLSNTLAEPIPLLLALVSTQGLGGGYRLYLVSAGPSTGE